MHLFGEQYLETCIDICTVVVQFAILRDQEETGKLLQTTRLHYIGILRLLKQVFSFLFRIAVRVL